MSPPLDDHTLNACLARVIGRKISEVKIGTHPNHVYAWMVFEANQWIKWNALHNANQMEEVEAWIAKTHNIEYVKYIDQMWGVGLWMPHGTAVCSKSDPDKKRAFALAIYQMEQASNGQ